MQNHVNALSHNDTTLLIHAGLLTVGLIVAFILLRSAMGYLSRNPAKAATLALVAMFLSILTVTPKLLFLNLIVFGAGVYLLYAAALNHRTANLSAKPKYKSKTKRTVRGGAK